jgi:hypothetical protein
MFDQVYRQKKSASISSQMFSFSLLCRCADDQPFVPIYQVSKDKVRSLGMELTPLDTSIKETIESLKEKGFFTFESSHL